MADTGSDVSMISLGVLSDKKDITKDEIFDIVGMGKGVVRTIGIKTGDLEINGEVLNQKFCVVPEGNLPEPYDVVLGEDFLQKHRYNILYGPEKVSLKEKEILNLEKSNSEKLNLDKKIVNVLNKTKIKRKNNLKQIGIKNLGKTCSLNAILQTMCRIKSFNEFIINCNKKGSFLKIMKRFIQNFGKQNSDNLKNLMLELKKNNSNIDFEKQQDVHEIYKMIENKLQKETEFDLTEGKILETLTCETCRNIITRTDRINEIILDISSSEDLNSCLIKEFEDRTICDYKCLKCKQKGGLQTKTVKFEVLPQILLLYLKKYDNKGRKLETELKYEEILEINGQRFNLKSIICHTGNENDGHYFTIVREKGKIYKYDDNQVSQLTLEELETYKKYVYMFIFEKELVKSCFYTKSYPLTVPPRSGKMINIEMPENGDYLCLNRELGNGLEIPSCVTKVTNNKGIISVLNNTDKEIKLRRLRLEFEPWSDKRKICLRVENLKKIDKPARVEKLRGLMNYEGLNSIEKEKLDEILTEYSDVFLLEGEKLSICNQVQHKIPIKVDSPIINVKPYRLPILQRTEINKQIKKMLQDGLICESKSPWNAPLLIVPKKTKEGEPQKWRLVVDFRKLNEITISDNFPLPNIHEVLDQLGKSKYFTTMDLSQGYHQIGMSPCSKELTAFSTPFGHYEWIRMPMGLKSASHTFQRLMNFVLLGINGLEAFVYLDDVVVYGSDLETIVRRIKKVLDRFRYHNLKLQPEKCNFLKREVIYLGHKITDKGMTPDPAKFEAIENFSNPKKTKDIKSFLGMVGHYRRYIPEFAKVAKPLTSLLKKRAKFIWSENCEDSFKMLKEKLIRKPILQYPDFEREFCLTTDASDIAVAAVLSQTDKETNLELPIAYASRTLLDAETRYSTTEKELLAVVWGVEHFHIYLYGRKFKILTDHKPLKWLMNIQDPSSRLMRWKIRLSKYEFEIHHISGKINYVADCLSRNIKKVEVNIVTRSGKRTNQEKGEKTLENKTEEVFKEVNSEVLEKENNEKIPVESESIEIPIIIQSDDCHLLREYNNRMKITSLEEQCSKKENLNRNFELGDVIVDENGYKTDFTIISKNKEEDQIIWDQLEKGIKFSIENWNLEKYGNKICIVNHEIGREKLIDFKNLIYELFINKGIYMLIYDNQKKILENEQDIQLILKEYHDNPLGGHQGTKRMLSRIGNKFMWKGMKKTIEEYVKKCKECQMNKPSKGCKMPMKITSIAKQPFERIAIDIVGPLPETINGNKYLLTFQDDLTRFVGAIPIANQEADTIAREFVHHIILKYGFRENLTVLSDMGSNFQSELFKNICKLLKIKKYNTSPWHPETNGGLERSHRTLKEYLRNYIDQVEDWDKFVEFGIFTINSTKNETTGYSPFELLYGQKMTIPTSFMTKIDPVYNYENYVFELRYKLQKAFEIARENQLRMKTKTKDYYDRNIRPIDFKVGDKVLIRNNFKKGEGRKLQPLYIGPYVIVDVISDTNVKIKIDGKLKIYHKNNIKIFYN